MLFVKKRIRYHMGCIMKTIGLLGGMSWESTVTYYQIINNVIKQQLGSLHSAKILLYSVDFSEIEACQTKGDWEKSGVILRDAAQRLERAGADFIVIATNTMHKVAPQIQAGIKIPILSIAEATAEVLQQNAVRRAALLGTKYTMTQDFYKNKLMECGIEVLIPDHSSIELINNVIYSELCVGILSSHSKEAFCSIIHALASKGAQGVILGCTEIGLLIHPEDSPLPVFDTTQIHAKKAAMLAIQEEIKQ